MEIKEKIAELIEALSRAEQSSDLLELSRELHELTAVLVHQDNQQPVTAVNEPIVDIAIVAKQTEQHAKIGSQEPSPIPPTPVFDPVANVEPNPPITESASINEEQLVAAVQRDAASLDATPSLNDRMSDKASEATLADKLHAQARTSIKSMIDLNAKIGFANALFGGNMNTFNQVVGQLDEVVSKADALAILANHNLPNDSEMSESLVQLLDRKFV